MISFKLVVIETNLMVNTIFFVRILSTPDSWNVAEIHLKINKII